MCARLLAHALWYSRRNYDARCQLVQDGPGDVNLQRIAVAKAQPFLKADAEMRKGKCPLFISQSRTDAVIVLFSCKL